MKTLTPYRSTPDNVLASLQSRATGLTDEEARGRLERDGDNNLKEVLTVSPVRRYLLQFKDWIIALLLASAVAMVLLGDIRTAVVLFALVLFNTLVGFFQEYRAEQTIKALKRLVHPVTEVYRNDKAGERPSEELVVGDIIHLHEGGSIPADARIIESLAFATNEFALTGESRPSYKQSAALAADSELSGRTNMVYMGTTVASGSAYAVVTGTGMRTELGRVASLAQGVTDDLSPLQKETKHIATYVTYGIVILSCVLGVAAAFLRIPFNAALLFIVGMACSIIPQGLPAEISASLSQAAGKLARAKALVKRLSSVETLGATHIICTDKTGTLTKNEMTVTALLVGTTRYDVTGTGYGPEGTIVREDDGDTAIDLTDDRTLLAAILASDAKIVAPDKEHAAYYCLGDPTEGALITLAMKAGFDVEKSRAQYREAYVFPFDSTRKRMTSIRLDGESVVAYVKGAPEAVLERATQIMIDGKIMPLTSAFKDEYLTRQRDDAAAALRTIAVAYRPLDTVPTRQEQGDATENDLILLGMVSMVDPLRDGVKDAMAAARAAHIRVAIVTGDFALTAESIARQAGLVGEDEEPRIITGRELAAMADADVLRATSAGGTVFARVSPEDKMRIVGLVKDSGRVVAVTGDGINDAPALKKADIGVAMGLSGTDVAKQSADLVLLDDSFGTLIGAVREGRTIFINIRKGILSCFTSNIAELVVNLSSLGLIASFGLAPALNVLQLLAIDLLAEFFPIAALGWDKEEKGYMTEPPRDPRAHILNRYSLVDILVSGAVMGVLGIANYVFFYLHHGYGLFGGIPQAAIYSATTITYVTVVLCQLVNIISRRSTYGLFTRYQFNNARFWIAIAFSLVIISLITYAPVVSSFFKSGPLVLADWLCVAIAVILFAAFTELRRRFIRPVTPQKTALSVVQ